MDETGIAQDGELLRRAPRGDAQRAGEVGRRAWAVEGEQAGLAFYGRLMAFDPSGRHGAQMAFLDAGDQFLALAATPERTAESERHFGLVVDDRAALHDALRRNAVEVLPGRGLSFRDPWGNRVQVVQYVEIRFTKAPEVLRGMGVNRL